MGHPTLQPNAFLRGGKPRKGAGESRQGYPGDDGG